MRMDSASSRRDKGSASDLSTHSVTAETLTSVSLRTDSAVINANTANSGSTCYSVCSVESAFSVCYSPNKRGLVSVFPDFFRLFGLLVTMIPLFLLCCGCGPSKKQYAINEALLIDQTRILEDEIYRMRFEVQQLKTENERLREFTDKREQASTSEETSRSRRHKQSGKVPFDIPVDRATGQNDINARTFPKTTSSPVPDGQSRKQTPQQEVQSPKQNNQSIQQPLPSPQQLVPGMQQENPSPQQPSGPGASNQPDNNGVRKILVIPKTVSYDANNETLPAQIVVPRKPGQQK